MSISIIMQKTAILILAAGGSSRMGKPKLVEKIQDTSLIEKVLDAVSALNKSPRLIILGGYKEFYLPQVKNSGIDIIINDNWQEGISTSIKIGIENLIDKWNDQMDSVLILLADMALVNSKYLDRILKAARDSGKGIIASDFGPSLGPPVIFDRKYFPELQGLMGDRGAKSVILNHPEDIHRLDFPDGLVDIDTPDDLKQLNRRQ
jgi:molybdenum cofactor cytidylyltransferase